MGGSHDGVIFIAVVVGFLALSIVLTYAFVRLRAVMTGARAFVVFVYLLVALFPEKFG